LGVTGATVGSSVGAFVGLKVGSGEGAMVGYGVGSGVGVAFAACRKNTVVTTHDVRKQQRIIGIRIDVRVSRAVVVR